MIDAQQSRGNAMSGHLYDSHPSMFKNRPVAFSICVLLIPAVIGIIVLLVWWLQVKGTHLAVDSEKTTLRRGILSKHTNEVYHRDVRNIKVSQSLFQRIFGVGAIEVSSAGQADEEIDVAGIPNPAQVKDLINAHRGATRGQGGSRDSTADQLLKLADLKAKGILSEAEFQTQKARILA